MTHEVDVQELQEHVAEYMKKVQDGDTVLVKCEGQTIARIEPPEEKPQLTWAHRSVPGIRFQDVPLPDIPELDFDIVDTIREDRDSR